jgi:hypothetical protein
MIGLDGSFPEPPDEEKNDKITSHDGKEREKYLSVKINDRQFWTTGELLAMAQDCERLFDKPTWIWNYRSSGRTRSAPRRGRTVRYVN